MIARRLDSTPYRQRMVEEQLVARGISDAAVLKAMRRVPRELFVRGTALVEAYQDGPLPLPCGQTISQPYIVALMSEALQLRGDEKVLEVGTGCGYQTAVLACLAGAVYSIERHAALYRLARRTLEGPGYPHVHLRHGDGLLGWPEVAPFAGILVAATATAVPVALREQLSDGGRLVIPIRGSAGQETLEVIQRQGSSYRQQSLLPVRFVPLVPGVV